MNLHKVNYEDSSEIEPLEDLSLRANIPRLYREKVLKNTCINVNSVKFTSKKQGIRSLHKDRIFKSLYLNKHGKVSRLHLLIIAQSEIMQIAFCYSFTSVKSR
jgi:hypothetical protein